MAVIIRAAVLNDINAILALEQSSLSAAHWSLDQYKKRVSDGIFIVGEREGQLCGFLCARVAAGEWEIENVVVAPELRGQGIGSELMQSLINQWKAAGGTAILLEVRESNAAARALYERCGLREVGRRRNYYPNPVEDAVLYARNREPIVTSSQG